MPSHSSTDSHKKSISLPGWVGIGVVLLAGLAWALWLFLPVNRLLEQQAHDWLRQRGIEAEFRITRATTSQMEIADIRLPEDGLTIEQAVLTYSPGGLWDGQVQDISLTHASIVLRQDEEGEWGIPGLPLPATAEDEQGFTLPALPFRSLTVEDASLRVKPAGKPAITAQAALELKNDYTGSLHLSHVTIPLEGHGSVELEEVRLQRAEAQAPFTFSVSRIAHVTDARAFFTPLQAEGSLEMAREIPSVEGIIHISSQIGAWKLDVEGSYDFAAKQWQLAFEQPMTQFETGILQPDMVFPYLRGHVTQVTGGIALSGKAQSTAEGMASSGEIRFDGVNAEVIDIPVQGVAGNIALSSLWPPATAGKQTVTLEEIVLGLPLHKGAIGFTLRPDGTIVFSPSTWEWAGGKLRTSGTSINIHNPHLPATTLSATDIALEELLAGLLKQGISATGRLDGTLPVSFTSEGDAMIKDGLLETKGGGTIRYDAGSDSPLQLGQSFQTDLLLQAMQNFRYETLSMRINSRTADDVNVLLHVKGRNPELYDGQAIELNINLNGNLLDIMQSGMNIYTLPERLEEQLMQ